MIHKDTYSVFGGSGFIGGHFVESFSDQVRVVPRESNRPLSDHILYFISTTHNYHVFDDIHVDIDTNLSKLVSVLKNLKSGKSTFNFISSWFVYGDTQMPASESSYCHPKGFYSITKRCAEQLIESYCRSFHIDYRILRLCNVYGEDDEKVSKKRNALQFLIDRLKKNESIELYHGGMFYRDYMHISDIIRAVFLIIEKGELNTIYNIGSGSKILFKDIIKMCQNLLKSKSEICDIEPSEFHRMVQVKNFTMNIERLKTLGFVPSVSMEEGIKRLCQ